MSKRLFLIDGHAFIFRAFFAIPHLSNSKGEPTNAIYGFWAMVQKILDKEKPDAVAVCFDMGKPTFRHEKYEGYKADRPEMHEDLVEQLPGIRELVEAHNIPIFEKEGYEADDLLGTLAKKGSHAGFEVFIATSDKDAMQLVNEKVKIYHAHKDGAVIDEAGVKEKLDGLSPKDVIEIMGLMGDASDQVPGVPGVGEKTAVKLIKEFHSIKGVYQNLDKVKGAKLQENLKENKDKAELSKELVTIDCDVPIDFSEKNLLRKTPDEKKSQELFKKFEFRSFIKGEIIEEAKPEANTNRDYKLITKTSELEKLAAAIQKKKIVSIDTETTSTDPFEARLVGVSISIKAGEAFFIPIFHDSGKTIPFKEFEKVMKPILEDGTVKKCGQNIKYDFHILREAGIEMRGLYFDTMVASYLLTPNKLNHNLDDISRENLGIFKIKTSDVLGTGRNQISMNEVPIEKITEYASEDADCVFQLVDILEQGLKKNNLTDLFFNLEMPLVRVLAETEKNGVAIDTKVLKELSDKAEGELDVLSKKIQKIAGEEFNINSTKQLQEILFNKLKLPTVKKTKTGFSTDVSVLEKLASDYEIADFLLQYRERQKLKSTYLDALPEILNKKDNLIHTSFNQTVTATGRLSSSEPNLQNIPIKSSLGREIRKGFVPRNKNSKLLSADYSQIELRILAHFSGDEVLSKAFHEDLDIHSYTATLLYNIPEHEVTHEMRNAAKTINFSIIYGKTAYGLSKDLGISVKEAELFINSYFNRYEKVKDFLDSQKELAKKQGYLTTILGRRSYFPDINSRNMMARQFAERAAINAPMQGSAADLIKKAMIDVEQALEKKKLKTLMTLQVHDELVFDVPLSELKEVQDLVKEKMEHAIKLKVPLKVDVYTGPSWYKGD